MKDTVRKTRSNRKPRVTENIRYIVNWVEGNTLYFRSYKRDNAACDFQEYLISTGIPQSDVRIIMK